VLALLGTPHSFDRTVLEAILASPHPVVASHRCAARLHGLSGPAPIVELQGLGAQRCRLDGVVAHRTTVMPPSHVEVVSAVPVTTMARTLFDLSAVVRPERVARMLDTSLARRSVNLVGLSRVARDLSGRGRRKTTVIRAILEARGDDFVAPESELEQEFVNLMDRAGLPQPDRQVDLGDAGGWVGRVDFLHRPFPVISETDGREHHTSLLDRLADEERDRRLRAAGFTVLRFTWFDVVHRPDWTVASIRRALATTSPLRSLAG
jgi:hypothetical protein